MDKVFEAFGQTEVGREAQEGTGLGLPISRKFAQLMRGDITVKSEVGKGATFVFHIQADVIEAADITEALSTRRVVALEPGQPHYRILVVDDRVTNRQLVVKLLSDLGPPVAGFDLREATNGQEAIELWETWKPHLIWMDMRMPVMDGYEATKKIKQSSIVNRQSSIIIALTASSLEEERAAILDAGCDDYLYKPFREAEMFDLLHKHLGVRFVYEAGEPSREEKKSEFEEVLRPEILAMLPADWLTAVHNAAERLQGRDIFNLLEQLTSEQDSVAQAIADLVENFKFEELAALTNLAIAYKEEQSA